MEFSGEGESSGRDAGLQRELGRQRQQQRQRRRGSGQLLPPAQAPQVPKAAKRCVERPGVAFAPRRRLLTEKPTSVLPPIVSTSVFVAASATRKQLGVLRYPLTSIRPSIIGRENFFVRFGDKEREAIASFDFLEDFSTTSASGCSSCDTLG